MVSSFHSKGLTGLTVSIGCWRLFSAISPATTLWRLKPPMANTLRLGYSLSVKNVRLVSALRFPNTVYLKFSSLGTASLSTGICIQLGVKIDVLVLSFAFPPLSKGFLRFMDLGVRVIQPWFFDITVTMPVLSTSVNFTWFLGSSINLR